MLENFKEKGWSTIKVYHKKCGTNAVRVKAEFCNMLETNYLQIECQRPFKALVLGSSPSQPRPPFPLGKRLNT